VTRLAVPAFHQREAECGNTSLKAVCWFHGWRWSARRLGALARGTHDGIDHAGLVRAARATGGRVTAGSGSLETLRESIARGLPVVVGWWDGEPALDASRPLAERRALDCGHYSVITGVGATRVQMMDPLLGHTSMAIERFLPRWYDTDGPRYRRVDRWFLVPEP